jgi:dTDP-4-amino-4,6-dideoxygalactose transaminase
MPREKTLENKFINVDQTDVDQVIETLRAGQLAGTADIVATYETALAHAFKSKHALAVTSGTAALHLLMMLYRIGPGDEVILPPTAPIMSVLPVVAVGATPIFADTESQSFGFDPEDLAAKITSQTKAVLMVPMWGYPVETTTIRNLVDAHGIALIEDASHCHGSLIDDRFVGTIGHVGFFSTQERKLVATGEGGFIVTDDDAIAQRIKELRDFGKPLKDLPGLPHSVGQYGHLFGLNFRLNAMGAALGIAQVAKLPAKIAQRTRNASFFTDSIQDLPWLRELHIGEKATPNYYSLVLHAEHPRLNNRDIGTVLNQAGIISDTFRFDIKPLYELPLLAEFRSTCINATNHCQSVITIPTHEGLEDADRGRIIETLHGLTAN